MSATRLEHRKYSREKQGEREQVQDERRGRKGISEKVTKYREKGFCDLGSYFSVWSSVALCSSRSKKDSRGKGEKSSFTR